MSENSNAKLLMQFHADLDKLPRTEDNWRLKIAYKALADLFDRRSEVICIDPERQSKAALNTRFLVSGE